MNYIHVSEYDPDVHVGYKKYAQVQMQFSEYHKPLPTVTQLIYSDTNPNEGMDFGAACRHVEIDEGNPVRIGMVLDPLSDVPNNTNFLNASEAYRLLHTDAELLNWVRGVRTGLLNGTDLFITRHLEEQALNKPTMLTSEQFIELTNYRQALRDLPITVDLNNIIFPDRPDFL